VASAGASQLFNVFASGAVNPGLVDELGGSNLQGVGIEPGWAASRWSRCRPGHHHIRPLHSPALARRRGLPRPRPRPPASIQFDSLTLIFGERSQSFRRGDSNADGTTDISMLSPSLPTCSS